ncbi:MAG: hypothetical protein ACRD96_23055, partial [Bryobacteraceae bacterium]
MIQPGDVVSLAELIYGAGDGGDPRGRIAARAAGRRFESLTPYFGSLAPDPVHPSTFSLAIDGPGGQNLLLRLAPAAAPSSGLFPNAILIGRMQAAGREIVASASPFSSQDHDHLRTFAHEVDRAFLPRPQGPRPAIAAGNRHPEISLPAAFDAFRAILRSTGVNMASTVQLSATREMTTDEAIAARDGENPTAAGHTRVSIRHLSHAGLWAAIRAGWREGYNAEADHFIVTGESESEIARSVESAKEAIRHAAGYTKFTTDTSRLFLLEADARHPAAWTDAAVEEKFVELFGDEERRWILDEFARPMRGEALGRAEIVRLAVKFGRSLKLNEE